MADLLSLDDYKVYQGISSSTKDDQMQPTLTSVSDLIKSYCNTSIIDNTGSPGITELFDIQWDTHVVQLKDSPILAVLSVEERSSQGDDYTVLLNDGTDSKYEWYLDTITDSILRTSESGSYVCYPKGVGSVRIMYTSGYATTPEDLKLAVVDTMKYYFNNEYKDRYALGGASIDNPGSTSLVNSAEFPDHIKRVLDLYKI